MVGGWEPGPLPSAGALDDGTGFVVVVDGAADVVVFATGAGAGVEHAVSNVSKASTPAVARIPPRFPMRRG